MEKTYWNKNGEEQAKYEEIMEAVDNGEYELTKKTENIFHRYYRYFNDGDLPGWARNEWGFIQYGVWGKELNEYGLKELERRTTEAINNEYKRFAKAQTRK